MNAWAAGVRRVAWGTLAGAHRAGMFGLFNHAANRFRRTERAPWVRRRRAGTVQILVYHRVAHGQDSYLPSTLAAAFERQMECLARRFRVLDLAEAVAALERADVPDNAVVITFDDGYRDNFELAFPILRALSLPVTIFLTTGVIGTNDMLWHDRLFRLFDRTTARELPGFGPDRTVLPLCSRSKEASLYHVIRQLRTLDPARREHRLLELGRALGVDEPPRSERLMLSWDEVREMHRGGVSFGGHTVSHPVLSRVEHEQARHEILESKREIERRLGVTVDRFAYPNGRAGDFDLSTKRLVREAGYRYAVTTIFGANSAEAPGWDPLELRRGGPDEHDAALFAAKMNLYRFLA